MFFFGAAGNGISMALGSPCFVFPLSFRVAGNVGQSATDPLLMTSVTVWTILTWSDSMGRLDMAYSIEPK